MDGVFSITSVTQLTSVAAVVSAAVGLTWVVKRLLGSVRWVNCIPVWCYTSAIAGGLAYVANRVTGTLPGVTGSVVIDAIVLGAASSGFRKWWLDGPGKPMGDSGTAVQARIESHNDRVSPRDCRSWLLPLLLVSSLAGLSACAASPRAKLVQTHQGIQTTLATLDDVERLLCWDTVIPPADGTRCTTEAARLAGLTPARHQAISRGFIKAYEAQLGLGKVIAGWTPGAPVDFDLIDKASAEIDAQLKLMNLSLPALQPLIQSIREWSVEIEKLKKLFGR